MSTTTNEMNVTWLTQEAFDRLQAEHDQLVANRPTMAREINDRREEGDLKENGGYHAAKEEQGKQEARIRQLQDLLRTAKVGQAPAVKSGVVEQGTVVTVRFAGDEDTEEFLIGSREETETTDLDVYSPQSPIGKAVTGARKGETREYELPNGTSMQVTIVDTKPFGG